MLIKIIAVGKKMPAWVIEGYEEYAKRFPTDFKLNLLEITAEKRHKNSSIAKLMQQEGKDILAQLNPDDVVIALDERGKHWSSMQLAKQLDGWYSLNQTIALLVGGPDGLSTECKQRAQYQWSLSSLTLPHPLVRIVLAEQLYRAISILQNHPYHREGGNP